MRMPSIKKRTCSYIPFFYILSLAVCSYLFFGQNLVRQNDPFLFQWFSLDITRSFDTALNVLYVPPTNRAIVFIFAALCGMVWFFNRDSAWSAFGLTLSFIFCFCAVIYPGTYTRHFTTLSATEQQTIIDTLLSVSIKNRYTLTAELLIKPPLAFAVLFQTHRLLKCGNPVLARTSFSVAALNAILCVCNISTGLDILALLIAYLNWKPVEELPPVSKPSQTLCGEIYIIEAAVFLVYCFFASVIGFDTPTLPASASPVQLFLLNAHFILILFLIRHFLPIYRFRRNTEELKKFLWSISFLYFIAFSAMLYPYHYARYIINNEIIQSFRINDVDMGFFPCISVLSVTIFTMHEELLKKSWYLVPLILTGIVGLLVLPHRNNVINDIIGSIPSLLIAEYGFSLVHKSKRLKAQNYQEHMSGNS